MFNSHLCAQEEKEKTRIIGAKQFFQFIKSVTYCESRHLNESQKAMAGGKDRQYEPQRHKGGAVAPSHDQCTVDALSPRDLAFGRILRLKGLDLAFQSVDGADA